MRCYHPADKPCALCTTNPDAYDGEGAERYARITREERLEYERQILAGEVATQRLADAHAELLEAIRKIDALSHMETRQKILAITQPILAKHSVNK